MSMTRWMVVQEEGFPGVWSVQKVDANGETSYPRNRWRGISCIDAQVIVAELERAYREGMAAGAREAFTVGPSCKLETLGDD